LETDEVEEILKDCAAPADEDGFTPYAGKSNVKKG